MFVAPYSPELLERSVRRLFKFKMVRIRWQPILVGLLIGVVLAVCGVLFSGGGHNFAFMMVFFPWAMLLSTLFTEFAWWPIVVGLILLQFPLYGALPSMVGKGRAAFWGAVGLLVVIHVLGIVWCFVFDRSESWRILFRW